MSMQTAFGRAAGALTILAVLAAATSAFAQAVKVERIEVARPGIYEIEVGKPIPDAGVGARIEARRGTIIGAELTIVGTPRRGKVPLKMIWSYPAPGLTNPDTKTTKTTDEYADTQLIGEKFPVFWGLTQDWHLVPGIWTLEVWQGERKLLTQTFELVAP
jgi:uncharacterized protein (DUF58 family)